MILSRTCTDWVPSPSWEELELIRVQYLVLKYSSTSSNLSISYYSPGVVDMLCLNLPNGDIAPIYNKDIFKILAEHSLSTAVQRALKLTVRENVKKGNAVSVELGLMTGMETRRGGFNIMGDRRAVRTEEKYVSHWTPLKDEDGRTRWVVLTIAPK
jgi:phototropin